MIPAWILDIFAAVMLAVAAVSAARLVAARARSHAAADSDIDVAHVFMGVAMAGMLAAGLRTLPYPAWAAIFAVLTVWFGWRVAAEAVHRRIAALGESHHLPHLVHGAAMVYMFLAITGAKTGTASAAGGMGATRAGMETLRLPVLAFAFILFMAGWAVWDIDRVSSSSVGDARGRARYGLARPGLGRQLTLAATRPGHSGALAGALAGAGVVAGAGSIAAASTAAGSTAAALSATTARLASAGSGLAGAAGAAGAATEQAAAAVRAHAPGTAQLTDPRVAIGCRIAMSVTMALMLVLMI